jgi:D-alanine transfer protein
MKNSFIHLCSAGAALLILAAGVVAGIGISREYEERYVYALALKPPQQVLVGVALQRVALEHPDLLPVYGSSEVLTEGMANPRPEMLADFPTGFLPFMAARPGVTTLEIAQNLAALGPALRDRKLVISFTPSQFNSLMVGQDQYAGNFSQLHAKELIFSPDLSMGLKARAARRMLQYPGTLEKQPLLKFAMENLARGSWVGDLLYTVALPLGWADTLITRAQDQYETVTAIRDPDVLKAKVVRQPRTIDWDAEAARADAEENMLTVNNPYGIYNGSWDRKIDGFVPAPPGSHDADFLSHITKSLAWEDLDILLGILNELHARPLVMSRPVNQPIWTALGVSPDVQGYYYTRLAQTVQPYRMTLVNFREHESDRLFSTDQSSHTSRKGWVYVYEAMDAFFHDRIR